MIAKCGCNCSKCPSYRENLKTPADREYCSRGWEEYLKIKLRPEKLRPCDGCDVPDEKRMVTYLNCRVRKCAIFNGIKNCAFCSEFPCVDVAGLHIVLEPDFRKKIEERLGKTIPEKDYLAFIEPYEGIKHLDEIRKLLRPEDIVKMTPVKSKSRICPFPADLQLSQKKKSLYQQIHHILSTVETGKNISVARQFFLEGSRKNILKLLWAFGLHGEFDEGSGGLVLSSEIYSAQKITSYLSRIQEYFKILYKYGFSGDLVPIDEKNWRTPSGALRKTGWYIKLFWQGLSSRDFLKALKCYSDFLDKTYGKDAFRYFSRADFRVLLKE